MASDHKVALRELSSRISRPVRIGMYESVVEIVMEDDRCYLRTECYDVHESRRETRIKSQGTRLYAWSRSKSGPWDCLGVVTVWDESFVPVVHLNRGKCLSFAEWRDQLNYERDCHRPGTPRHPLDNFDRVFDGLDCGIGSLNTKKMEKHWPLEIPTI